MKVIVCCSSMIPVLEIEIKCLQNLNLCLSIYRQHLHVGGGVQCVISDLLLQLEGTLQCAQSSILLLIQKLRTLY